MGKSDRRKISPMPSMHTWKMASKHPRANGFRKTTVVEGGGIGVAFYTCIVNYGVDGICGYARFDGCRSDIQNLPGQLERRAKWKRTCQQIASGYSHGRLDFRKKIQS